MSAQRCGLASPTRLTVASHEARAVIGDHRQTRATCKASRAVP